MNIKSTLLAAILCACACLNSRADQLPFDVRWGYCDNSIFYMVDRNDGWARGTNAILKTTDGGNTWHRTLLAEPRQPLGAFFYNAKTAWAVVGVEDDATNATVFHTSNGGRSWTSAELSERSPIMGCYLSFPDKRHGWMMLIPDHGMNSSPGELFRTDDAGKTWRHINTVKLFDNFDQPTDADLERVRPYPLCGGQIVFQDTKNGWLFGSFASTTPGYLFVTRDGGAHWQGQTLPLPTSLQHGRMAPVGLPSFSSSDGKDGTIEANFVPDNSGLRDAAFITYNTHDGGRTWQWGAPAQAPEKARKQSNQLAVQGKRISQLQFVDKNNGWAVALGNDLSGQLLRTKDGGKTWTEVRLKVQ